MSRKIRNQFYIVIVIFFITTMPLQIFSQGTNNWSNKNGGTYTIQVSPRTVFINFKDTQYCRIFVEFFELGKDSLKRLEGNLRINGRSFFVYDSILTADEDGEKYTFRKYFSKDYKSGIFRLKADAGPEYYPVKTDRMVLKNKISYTFSFYFIRRDELIKIK